MLSIQTQIKLYDIVYLLIHNGYNYTMRYKLDKKKQFLLVIFYKIIKCHS